MLPPDFLRKLKEENGVAEIPPAVSFFDYPMEDKALSEASGRPRFRAHTFIQKQTRGVIVPEIFHRRMEETDKEEFAEEWAIYQQKRDQVDNRAPSLMAMPGMDVASLEELKALDLTDCEKLAAYKGDLTGLEHFQKIAHQIMEISNGLKGTLHSGRNEIHNGVQRPVHGSGEVSGASGITPGTRTAFAGNANGGSGGNSYSGPSAGTGSGSARQEAAQKTHKENVTFAYSWSV